METQALDRSGSLRIVAVVLGSIVVAVVPAFVLTMLYTSGGIAKNTFLTQLALPWLSSLTMLSLVFVVARTGIVGNLEIVWWRSRHSEGRRTVLFVFVVLVCMYSVNSLVRRLGLQMRLDRWFWGDGQSVMFYVAMTINLALLGPIVEEVFWRGYVQKALGSVFGEFAALLSQAILFAAAHLRPFGGFVPMFVLGLTTGAWRWRRRTLVPVILVHMTINSLYCAVHWPDWLDLTRIRITADYASRIVKISRPADYDPTSSDARYDYQKAMQLVVKTPAELDDVRRAYPTDWSAQEREKVREWLDANQEALKHVAQGAEKTYYWPTYQGSSAIQITMPEAKHTRYLALALDTRVKLCASEGGYGPMLADTRTLYRFGMHMSGRKVLIDQLIGVSIRRMILDTMTSILVHESLPPETLHALQDQFAAFARGDVPTMDFTIEHLVWLDLIQMVFTQEAEGRGHIPPRAFSQPKSLQSLLGEVQPEEERALLRLDRRETTQRVEDFFRHIHVAARQTPWQLHSEPDSPRDALADLLREDAFIELLGSPCFRVMDLPWRERTSLDALVAALGIIRYRADHEQYPDSLEQLVEAGYLNRVPQDCYSNGPLIYRRTDDNFLLYSCGADFDDDGGAPSKWGEGEAGGDQVFWPVQEKD